MNFFQHLYRYFSKNWAILYISRKNPPIQGDTLSVGNVTATFVENPPILSFEGIEEAKKLIHIETGDIASKIKVGSFQRFKKWIESSDIAIDDTEYPMPMTQMYGLPIYEMEGLPDNKVMVVDSKGRIMKLFTLPEQKNQS